MGSIEPRNIIVGRGTMLVNSEDFLNGYQAGHLAYMLVCRTFHVTNESITTIMMEKLESMDYPEQYSVGYCIGWIATFAIRGNSV